MGIKMCTFSKQMEQTTVMKMWSSIDVALSELCEHSARMVLYLLYFQSKQQKLQRWQSLGILRFISTRLESLPMNHWVHEQTADGAVEAYEHVQLHIMDTRRRCHCWNVYLITSLDL